MARKHVSSLAERFLFLQLLLMLVLLMPFIFGREMTSDEVVEKVIRSMTWTYTQLGEKESANDGEIVGQSRVFSGIYDGECLCEPPPEWCYVGEASNEGDRRKVANQDIPSHAQPIHCSLYVTTSKTFLYCNIFNNTDVCTHVLMGMHDTLPPSDTNIPQNETIIPTAAVNVSISNISIAHSNLSSAIPTNLSIKSNMALQPIKGICVSIQVTCQGQSCQMWCEKRGNITDITLTEPDGSGGIPFRGGPEDSSSSDSGATIGLIIASVLFVAVAVSVIGCFIQLKQNKNHCAHFGRRFRHIHIHVPHMPHLPHRLKFHHKQQECTREHKADSIEENKDTSTESKPQTSAGSQSLSKDQLQENGVPYKNATGLRNINTPQSDNHIIKEEASASNGHFHRYSQTQTVNGQHQFIGTPDPPTFIPTFEDYLRYCYYIQYNKALTNNNNENNSNLMGHEYQQNTNNLIVSQDQSHHHYMKNPHRSHHNHQHKLGLRQHSSDPNFRHLDHHTHEQATTNIPHPIWDTYHFPGPNRFEFPPNNVVNQQLFGHGQFASAPPHLKLDQQLTSGFNHYHHNYHHQPPCSDILYHNSDQQSSGFDFLHTSVFPEQTKRRLSLPNTNSHLTSGYYSLHNLNEHPRALSNYHPLPHDVHDVHLCGTPHPHHHHNHFSSSGHRLYYPSDHLHDHHQHLLELDSERGLSRHRTISGGSDASNSDHNMARTDSIESLTDEAIYFTASSHHQPVFTLEPIDGAEEEEDC